MDLRFTPQELHEHMAARVATIERAIAFIEGTPLDDVYDVLNLTQLHQHLKDDPTALVDTLRGALRAGHTFGAWKGAQQICRAAGLEY